MFPSPYGDFVFQLDYRVENLQAELIEFPSPYGDFVFQLYNVEIDGVEISVSFRPLTGILFFNFSHDSCEQKFPA